MSSAERYEDIEGVCKNTDKPWSGYSEDGRPHLAKWLFADERCGPSPTSDFDGREPVWFDGECVPGFPEWVAKRLNRCYALEAELLRCRTTETAAAHALDTLRQWHGLELIDGEHPSDTRKRIEAEFAKESEMSGFEASTLRAELAELRALVASLPRYGDTKKPITIDANCYIVNDEDIATPVGVYRIEYMGDGQDYLLSVRDGEGEEYDAWEREAYETLEAAQVAAEGGGGE